MRRSWPEVSGTRWSWAGARCEPTIEGPVSGEGRGSIGVHSLGRHLLLELHDCSSEILNNLETVKAALVEAAKRAEATIIDVVFHEFNPFGISGVVVIAESHLSIHTWPEYRYAAVDIFSCGETLKPAEAANYLVEQFGASRASCVEVKRGVFPGIAGLANRVKEGVAGNGATEPLQMVL
jgi:S-adenosylmethionine decarboxylase